MGSFCNLKISLTNFTMGVTWWCLSFSFVINLLSCILWFFYNSYTRLKGISVFFLLADVKIGSHLVVLIGIRSFTVVQTLLCNFPAAVFFMAFRL